MSNSFRILACSLLAILPLSGCGSSDQIGDNVAEEDAAFLDDLFADVDLTDVPLPEEAVDNSGSAKTNRPAAITASISPAPDAKRVAAGLRFSLVKTVEQTLVQKSELYPANAKTRLELHMDLEVAKVQSEAMLLDVRYRRVVYVREINGERLKYDSQDPERLVPQQALPYAGMVQNGFAFWLDGDNQVGDAVGYDKFLLRCVQRMPEHSRNAFLSGFSGKLDREGVDVFLDDCIGLLPPQSKTEGLTVGDVWTRERRLSSPVPLKISTTCRLLDLSAETATIDLNDRLQAEHAGMSATVKVTGGRSMGSCTVDRTTGIPIDMNRSCYLDLVVMTAAGEAVEQEKRVETTIRSITTASASMALQRSVPSLQRHTPPMPAPQTRVPTSRGLIQQTSGTAKVSPNSAGLSSTTRAVYPD